eukprot:5813085-Lingulodinium_polyedra.AAC.1
MKYGKSKGIAVNMKIAGNSTHGAVMTEHGEVMMQSVQNKSDDDIGWILPVCRLQDDLGMAIAYQADGKTVLRAPDGQKVDVSRHQGLTF